MRPQQRQRRPERAAALPFRPLVPAGRTAGSGTGTFTQDLPPLAVSQLTQAEVLCMKHQGAPALPALREIYARYPRSIRALIGLVVCVRQTGDDDEAERLLKEAQAHGAVEPRITSELGLIYLKRGDNAAALSLLESAYRQSRPSFTMMARNYAMGLRFAGRFAESTEVLRRAMGERPDDAQLAEHLLMNALSSGCDEHAAGVFDAHIAPRLNQTGGAPLAPQVPEWDGRDLADLAGRSILLHDRTGYRAEHGGVGIGDEILNLFCLPSLLAAGPRAVASLLDARLIPLFSRRFPSVRFLSRTYGAPHIDAADALVGDGNDKKRAGDSRDLLALGPEDGAPYDFTLTVDHVRGRFLPAIARPERPVMLADPATVAVWRERLAAADPGARLRVGISWRSLSGRPAASARHVWEFTEIPDWRALFAAGAMLGVQFVNLQYDRSRASIAAEIEREQEESGGVSVVHDFADLDTLTDLEGVAALMSALDLVISIDNSVPHMADALGVPCFVLLAHAVNWRWGAAGESAPLFPCCRLFRQQKQGDWAPVFADVADAVQNFTP